MISKLPPRLQPSDLNRAQRRRLAAKRRQRTTEDQRRRLEALIAEDEARGRGSIDDRAFFIRHPERVYRMRLATPGEIETIAVIDGAPFVPHREELFAWTIVRQIAPGLRLRVGITAPLPEAPVDDIPEDIARGIFQQIGDLANLID
jgi:hypothetical protein